jgi:transcriptional regulator NrdR family protein
VFCPYCKADTRVTNSRPSAKHPEVWRRRQCKNCLNIWTTREFIDLSTSHRVRDHQNSFEVFSRDKLYLSIKDSLLHRKSATDDATALTDTVLHRVMLIGTADIAVVELVHITQTILRRFDATAGAIYAARYSD